MNLGILNFNDVLKSWRGVGMGMKFYFEYLGYDFNTFLAIKSNSGLEEVSFIVYFCNKIGVYLVFLMK